MSSDDSSDDEMMQKLREATDNNLFNDTMFNDSDTKSKTNINKGNYFLRLGFNE